MCVCVCVRTPHKQGHVRRTGWCCSVGTRCCRSGFVQTQVRRYFEFVLCQSVQISFISCLCKNIVSLCFDLAVRPLCFLCGRDHRPVQGVWRRRHVEVFLSGMFQQYWGLFWDVPVQEVHGAWRSALPPLQTWEANLSHAAGTFQKQDSGGRNSAGSKHHHRQPDCPWLGFLQLCVHQFSWARG